MSGRRSRRCSWCSSCWGYSAARCSGLRSEDVDLDQGVLPVSGPAPGRRRAGIVFDQKSRRAPAKRAVQLGSRRAGLTNTCANGSLNEPGVRETSPNIGYMFTSPDRYADQPRDCAAHHAERAAAAAELTAIQLHDLRDGCVSGPARARRSASHGQMEIAGHGALDMTMTVYGHVSHSRQALGLDDSGPVRRGLVRGCSHGSCRRQVMIDGLRAVCAASLWVRPKGFEP